HLTLRKGTSMKPVTESRAVYASLVDDTQPDGVLRSIYWDSQTVKRDSPVESTPVKIAAKMVKIPLSRVRQWMSVFEGIQTSFEVLAQAEYSWPICSLRVERDSVYSIFEKVWQVDLNHEDELQQAWRQVWQEMGQALQSSPAVTDIEEDYSHVEPVADALDFQADQPALDLP
ncbi:MAG: hypothetical protein ACRDHW_15120, partial [Ktedonobacteraceae bacterium]